MAISNYSDLKSKIAGFLARSGLDAEIADAISFFEAEYNASEDNYFAESAYTFDTVAGTALVALPADFNEPVSLSIASRGGVKFVSLSALNDMASPVQGQPTYAALYPGDRLKLSVTPDAVYAMELIYEANLASLTDAAPINWMLKKYPNVYLYGSLKYLLEYLQDGVRADRITAAYAGFLNGINSKKASKKLGAVAVMQTSRKLP